MRLKLNSPRIGIFDSGYGGLSILEHLPPYSIAYFADHKHFPYGLQKKEFLLSHLYQLIPSWIKKAEIDLLIIACNTASTLVLPELRSSCNIPIVGVVPAIKPAAKLSKSKIIGLLASPATVKSPYTHKLIKDFASDCEIISVGSHTLVQAAEDKLLGHPPKMNLIHKELLPLIHENLDVIILACTHFPHLKPEIQKLIPQTCHLIDSGKAIAKRVSTLLPPPTETKPMKIAYCNDKKNFYKIKNLTNKHFFDHIKLI